MKSVFIIITFFLFGNLFAQNNGTGFLEKKNQNTIDVQPLALGYSYAHMFKKNVTFGAKIQAGYGMPIRLAASSMVFDFGYGNGPEKYKTDPHAFEPLKFQLFYRYAVNGKFYFDAGPVASWVLSEDDAENPYNAGIGIAAYYLFWKINIGVRVEGVMSFDNDFNPDHTYYAVNATPIVIGINF